jgi:hypothetical protein
VAVSPFWQPFFLYVTLPVPCFFAQGEDIAGEALAARLTWLAGRGFPLASLPPAALPWFLCEPPGAARPYQGRTVVLPYRTCRTADVAVGAVGRSLPGRPRLWRRAGLVASWAVSCRVPGPPRCASA